MMATDEKCLACTHHPDPVCDGSGVRLIRDQADRVVDVEVCVRWPASWDEPIAYFEAIAQHRIGAITPAAPPATVWPAVQAEIGSTKQLSSREQHRRDLIAVGLFFAALAVALVIAVIRMVLS